MGNSIVGTDSLIIFFNMLCLTASSSSAEALNDYYLLLPAELRSNCAKLKGFALEPSSDAASC